MSAIFRNSDSLLEVGGAWVERLKVEAAQHPRRRSRLLMHMSGEDSIQEMLIAFCRDALIRPHKTLNKTESFAIVEGELLMVIFGDHGSIERKFPMGPYGSGMTFMTRFSGHPWYTYVPLSDFLVVHEITRGPFSASDTSFPDWAPEDESALHTFIDRLK